MKRTGITVWSGTLVDGQGHVSTQSPALQQTPYCFNSRFAENTGTNPEELLAAAYASCFTMKLSHVLGLEGIRPEWIETQCTITIEEGVITGSHLQVQARVPGLTQVAWEAFIENVKANSSISKVVQVPVQIETILH